ncbi:hypothetical protein [Acidiphilium cryptum]|nr:hypothetical protein [Acidiphilium cryptum]
MHRITVSFGRIRPVASVIIGMTVLLTNAAVVCIIARSLGADINWDLLNYHFYNGYLWAHGKLIQDSLCTEQSYLDPRLNFFYYLLIRNFAPLTVNLIIAGFQSLGISAAWLLCFHLLKIYNIRTRLILSSVAAISAIIGPIFWSEIGGTMGDTLLASPIILAIFFSLISQERDRLIYLFFAGLLVGFVAGLKFTNMIYAVGFVFAFILTTLYRYKFNIRRLVIVETIFCFSFLSGFVLLYFNIGYLLFVTYKNPIFPYFNNIFHSPYIGNYAIRDERWFPQNLIGYITLPFEFVVRHHPKPNQQHIIGMEIPFRTIFPALYFIISPSILLYLYFKKIKNNELYDIFFVLSFFAGSFFVWEEVFSYYRYFAAAEMIFPTILLVLLVRWGRLIMHWRHHSMTYVAAALLVATAAAYSLPDSNWGREAFSSSYFGASKREFKSYNNALLIVGFRPLGFILPYFPLDDRIIGLPEHLGITQKFQKKYLRPLLDYKNIYYLTDAAEIKNDRELPAHYGVTVNYENCSIYKTSIYPVAVCPVQHTP